MKRVSTVLGLFAGVTAIGALALGCGSSETAAATGTTTLAGPPAKPTTGMATATRRVFAINKLLLGDTDRSGTTSSTAWKKFGYDLDGVATKTSKLGTCKAISDGVVVIDGDNGIDNSFGQNILTALQKAASGFSEPSKTVTDTINKGDFTLILDVLGLDGSGTQTATGVTGQMFVGGSLGMVPKFDGTDNWPVSGALLVDAMDPSKGSKVKFPEAYITNGVWVNGGKTDVTLALSIQGVSLNLLIRSAIISAKHASASKLTEGTVAGYISVSEIVETIGKVAGRLSPEACPGKSLFVQVKQIIESNADIRLAGPDATKDCDAISIGLGFEAMEIKPPSLVAPVLPPGVDPCSATDAGAAPADAAPSNG